MFRIGERVAPACAGMSEGEGGRSEQSPLRVRWIFHEASRERGWDLKDSVDPGDEGGGHLANRFWREKTRTINHATVCEHGVEFC